jgi:hypothetical protein
MLELWRGLGSILLFTAVLHLTFYAVAVPVTFVLMLLTFTGAKSILQAVGFSGYAWIGVVMVAAIGKISARALVAIAYAWRRSASRRFPANDSGLMWWCFHLLTGGWLRGEILLQPCLLMLLLCLLMLLLLPPLAYPKGMLAAVVSAAAYHVQPLIMEVTKGLFVLSRVTSDLLDPNPTLEPGQSGLYKVIKYVPTCCTMIGPSECANVTEIVILLLPYFPVFRYVLH